MTERAFLQKVRNRMQTVWLEFIVALLHLVGYLHFHHVRRFFYRFAGMKIGKGSAIHMHTTFYNPRNIRVGKGTIVGEWAVLDGRNTLTIGDHVDIASEVMIYNAEHDIQSEDFHAVSAPTTIEDYAFIGPRAIILPGVTIGKGAVVGAGAVVTKDVVPFSIVGGVPAKVIGERKNTDPSYRLKRAAWFR